jgi:hypothetical protein
MRFEIVTLLKELAEFEEACHLVPKQLEHEPPAASELPKIQFDKEWFVELWRERSSIMCVENGMSADDADYQAFQEVRSMASEQIDASKEWALLPAGARCCHCGCRFVIERFDGLECWKCQRMAWMNLGGSIVRADFVLVVL